MMTPILIRDENEAMAKDEFIASMLSLKKNLEKEVSNLRELKAIYFGINLDYIRLCEVSKQMVYFPSRSCDLKMKKCTTQAHYREAIQIVSKRIDEVTESLR